MPINISSLHLQHPVINITNMEGMELYEATTKLSALNVKSWNICTENWRQLISQGPQVW